jgi:hypothetical protein
MQHLVRQFMHKGGELLSLGLAGKNGDLSAVAHAHGGRDLFGKDKLDTLLLNEGKQMIAVLAHVA